MSDFLKNNPLMYMVILMSMMLIFFLTIGKAQIDKGDTKVKKDISIEFLNKMDTLVKNDSTILEALKTLR